MKTSTLLLILGAGAVLYIATRPKTPPPGSAPNQTLTQVNQLGGTLSGLFGQLSNLIHGGSSSTSTESAQQAQQDANNLAAGWGLY